MFFSFNVMLSDSNCYIVILQEFGSNSNGFFTEITLTDFAADFFNIALDGKKTFWLDFLFRKKNLNQGVFKKHSNLQKCCPDMKNSQIMVKRKC